MFEPKTERFAATFDENELAEILGAAAERKAMGRNVAGNTASRHPFVALAYKVEHQCDVQVHTKFNGGHLYRVTATVTYTPHTEGAHNVESE